MRNTPIIVLIDMDCFYVQVELKQAPQYVGKETAVVQYNAWRGGGIIAVSYEARDKGVKRSMRGDQAKSICPSLHLFSVPECRGKADLSKYRSAGAEVIKCLSKHANCIERASIDEAFIDLTDEVDNFLMAAPDSDELKMFWEKSQHSSDGCHAIGHGNYNDWMDHVIALKDTDEYNDEIRLALGGFLVQRMREDVFKTLGYRCSAGIAHSKVVAKYACGVHKPNQQTIVSKISIPSLFKDALIDKIRNLGGKLGGYVQTTLNITTMGELTQFSLEQLAGKFGEKVGPWLFNLCRGQDDESVLSRHLVQSIGCSKNFPGTKQLKKVEKVRYWINQMAQEIAERIEEDQTRNSRVPTHMCVSYRQLRSDNEEAERSRKSYSGSRVVPLTGLTASAIGCAAFVVMTGVNHAEYRGLPDDVWFPPLLSLGLSTGKFRPHLADNDISRFLIETPRRKVTPAKEPTKPSPVKSIVVPDPGEACVPIRSDFISITDRPQLNICVQPFSKNHQDDLNQSSDAPPKKKSFFAKFMEEERKEQVTCKERPELIIERRKPVVTTSDYILCEQCSKNIVMWEAPEHFDWHVAKDLQKQLSREVIEEEAKNRQTKSKPNDAKPGMKRKRNDDKVTMKSNQLTLDHFYRK